MAKEAEIGSSTRTEVNLDQAKFELEKLRIDEDIKLRREELELKRKEASKSAWSSPLLVGMVGLFATLLASIVQNILQASANTKLEQRRSESAMIQKALEPDDDLTAKHRFERLLSLHVITDQHGNIKSWLAGSTTKPVDDPREAYVGEDRRAAKLSVGNGAMESFSDLADLIASLPSSDAMHAHVPKITTGPESARVAEEQRNVHLRAFLYAASREADSDFHLIVGLGRKADREMYMTAVISGLPPSTSPAFAKLSAARSAFKQFFGQNPPGLTYDFYGPPIPVEIEGSLFFDAAHSTGQMGGPPSLKDRMPTLWEIHPVTSIKLDL